METKLICLSSKKLGQTKLKTPNNLGYATQVCKYDNGHTFQTPVNRVIEWLIEWPIHLPRIAL